MMAILRVFSSGLMKFHEWFMVLLLKVSTPLLTKNLLASARRNAVETDVFNLKVEALQQSVIRLVCLCLLDPFLILIGLTQEQTHSHPSNWRQRPCPPRFHDAAFVFSLHCVCVRFVCRFFRLQLVHACMHRRRHQCRGLACRFWRQDPAIVACQL